MTERVRSARSSRGPAGQRHGLVIEPLRRHQATSGQSVNIGTGAVLTIAVAQRVWLTVLEMILSASGFVLNRALELVGR